MKMERICKILLVLIVGFFISLSPITSSYLKADTVQDIKEITELYKEGLLTKEEFSKAKAKILGIEKQSEKEQKAKNKLKAKEKKKRIKEEARKAKLKAKEDERKAKIKAKSQTKKKLTKTKVSSSQSDPLTVIDHVKALGTFKEPSSYPEGMKETFGNCKTFYCIQSKATKKMGKIFSRTSVYYDRHPGAQLYGMAFFEVFYLQKLKKEKSKIEEFIANWPDKNKHAKSIVALLKTNKSRKKMREALGMDLNTSVEEAMERFWLMGDFLEQGEVKKKKVNKDIKKRGALLAKYKKSVGSFNSAIKKLEDKKLYDKIEKKK